MSSERCFCPFTTVCHYDYLIQGLPSTDLREVVVPIYNRDDCQAAYENVEVITDNMICAGYTWGGSSACQVRRGVHLNSQCIGDISNMICAGYTRGGGSPCQVRRGVHLNLQCIGDIRNMICAGYTWGGSSACQVRQGVHLNLQCIGDIRNMICAGYTWGGSSAC